MSFSISTGGGVFFTSFVGPWSSSEEEGGTTRGGLKPKSKSENCCLLGLSETGIAARLSNISKDMAISVGVTDAAASGEGEGGGEDCLVFFVRGGVRMRVGAVGAELTDG